jgi:hypothetical protein
LLVFIKLTSKQLCLPPACYPVSLKLLALVCFTRGSTGRTMFVFLCVSASLPLKRRASVTALLLYKYWNKKKKRVVSILAEAKMVAVLQNIFALFSFLHLLLLAFFIGIKIRP